MTTMRPFWCFFKIVFVVFFFPYLCSSATFFLANDGSDSNSGITALQPWRTIGRLNQALSSFQRGDVVLLRRGDTFRETLTLPLGLPSDVLLSSYGSSELPRPTIAGSLLVPPGAPWVAGANNVYSLDLAALFPPSAVQRIAAVHVDGSRMTLARWPNRNLAVRRSMFAFADSWNGTSTLTSSELTQPSGYWVNATARIRVNNWSYEESTVVSYVRTAGRGVLTTSTAWTGLTQWTDGFGFYLDNVLSELDHPGEWYYDTRTSRIYLRTPSSDSPAGHRVELVTLTWGIIVRAMTNNLTISNINFAQQSIGIASSLNQTALTISNCSFSNQETFAVSLSGQNMFNEVIDSSFTDIHGVAVYMRYGLFNRIANNVMRNIALWEGQSCGSGWWHAIVLKCADSIVANNDIADVGAIAIMPQGRNMTIDSNVITRCMSTVNDGGCIYTAPAAGGNAPLVIVNNVVSDSVGQVDSCGSNYSHAFGIYLDASTQGVRGPVLIMNNTLSNHGQGALQLVSSANVTIVANRINDDRADLGLGIDSYNSYWTHQHYLIAYPNGGESFDRTAAMNNSIACNDIRSVGLPLVSIANVPSARFFGNVYCSPNPKAFRLGTDYQWPNASGWSSMVVDQGSKMLCNSEYAATALRACDLAAFVPAVFASLLPAAVLPSPLPSPIYADDVTTAATPAASPVYTASTRAVSGTSMFVPTTVPVVPQQPATTRAATAFAIGTGSALLTTARMPTSWSGPQVGSSSYTSASMFAANSTALLGMASSSAAAAAAIAATTFRVPTTSRVTTSTGTTSTGTTSTGTTSTGTTSTGTTSTGTTSTGTTSTGTTSTGTTSTGTTSTGTTSTGTSSTGTTSTGTTSTGTTSTGTTSTGTTSAGTTSTGTTSTGTTSTGTSSTGTTSTGTTSTGTTSTGTTSTGTTSTGTTSTGTTSTGTTSTGTTSTGTTSTGTTSTGTSTAAATTASAPPPAPTGSVTSYTRYFWQGGDGALWNRTYSSDGSPGFEAPQHPYTSTSQPMDTTLKGRDQVYARAIITPGQVSATLIAQRTGDAVPAAAAITGVRVVLVRHASSGGVREVSMSLVVGGIPQAATNKFPAGAPADWPLSSQVVSVGSATDLWSLPAGRLTPATVNSLQFGVALQLASDAAQPVHALIDEIDVIISYYLPPTTTTVAAGPPSSLEEDGFSGAETTSADNSPAAASSSTIAAGFSVPLPIAVSGVALLALVAAAVAVLRRRHSVCKVAPAPDCNKKADDAAAAAAAADDDGDAGAEGRVAGSPLKKQPSALRAALATSLRTLEAFAARCVDGNSNKVAPGPDISAGSGDQQASPTSPDSPRRRASIVDEDLRLFASPAVPLRSSSQSCPPARCPES